MKNNITIRVNYILIFLISVFIISGMVLLILNYLEKALEITIDNGFALTIFLVFVTSAIISSRSNKVIAKLNSSFIKIYRCQFDGKLIDETIQISWQDIKKVEYRTEIKKTRTKFNESGNHRVRLKYLVLYISKPVREFVSQIKANKSNRLFIPLKITLPSKRKLIEFLTKHIKVEENEIKIN